MCALILETHLTLSTSSRCGKYLRSVSMKSRDFFKVLEAYIKTFRVKATLENAKYFEVTTGVRQGCVFSTLLHFRLTECSRKREPRRQFIQSIIDNAHRIWMHNFYKFLRHNFYKIIIEICRLNYLAFQVFDKLNFLHLRLKWLRTSFECIRRESLKHPTLTSKWARHSTWRNWRTGAKKITLSTG